jgi:5,10-methylenetetrahydrofolate reductase
MHDIEADTSSTFNIKNVPATVAGQEPKIIDLITDHLSTNRRFFSIEVSPRNNFKLDYNSLKNPPLFTAITWFGNENLPQGTDNLQNAPSIKMGLAAKHSTPILHHITCHNLNERHVDDLLALNVKNVLALTGGEKGIQHQSLRHL